MTDYSKSYRPATIERTGAKVKKSDKPKILEEEKKVVKKKKEAPEKATKSKKKSLDDLLESGMI